MKVLVPVDGSENSLRAVEYAAKHAEKHPDYEVTLLSVACYAAPWLTSEVGTMEQVENACISHYGMILEKTRAIFDDRGIKVNSVMQSGDPAEVICSYVQDNGIDKVIMGSRGMGSFIGAVLGSVSHKVLNTCSAPVTIIK